MSVNHIHDVCIHANRYMYKNMYVSFSAYHISIARKYGRTWHQLLHVCMYISMYISMYVCIHVYMYVYSTHTCDPKVLQSASVIHESFCYSDSHTYLRSSSLIQLFTFVIFDSIIDVRHLLLITVTVTVTGYLFQQRILKENDTEIPTIIDVRCSPQQRVYTHTYTYTHVYTHTQAQANTQTQAQTHSHTQNPEGK